jgi:glycosyltransferase involved in cell wall biosynthesis
MTGVKRLLLVTHVPHYRHEGRLYAYGPYVREVNVWCDLFPEVVIAAPCFDAPPKGDGLAFSRDNLSIYPVPQSGGETVAAKLYQLILLPWIVLRLCVAMSRADAIHVRCPGNLGLLGVLLGPIFCHKLVAKYAGQWNGFPGESRTVTLQRWLLGSRWWRGVVTVYGDWPGQPDHVVSFFTSVMTPEQISLAKQIATRAKLKEPFTLVFVGRLTREKNVDVLLQSVSQLCKEGLNVRCNIVGHGPQLDSLKALADELKIEDRVYFAGGIDFDRVFDFYDQSHALVLASETEGWPKAIAEAMACGLVCVGSNRGLVPWMLGEGRGFTVTPRNVAELTDVLRALATSESVRTDMSRSAAEFGQRYSLDSLRQALKDLLSERWQVDLQVSTLHCTEPSRIGFDSPKTSKQGVVRS